MALVPKVGALTATEIQQLWESSVDRLYSQPFLEDPDGSGFEAWGQLFAQLGRASAAIDATTQELFIFPWSGQSGPSAGAGVKSEVTLTIGRTANIQLPMVIGREVAFEEVAEDASADGTIERFTGRRYFLAVELVFAPGDPGPYSVVATAERTGRGYDNPEAGSIRSIDQVGANLSNTGATITADQMYAANRPDAPVPEHVGAYMRFTAGANAGQVRRVFAYGSPVVPLSIGGSFIFDRIGAIRATYVSGTAILGEPVELRDVTAGTVLATGTLLVGVGVAGLEMLVVRVGTGFLTLVGGHTVRLVGLQSAVTWTLVEVTQSDHLADAVGTESWRVLSWGEAFGVTVTNVTAPSGGRAPMLDALGKERGITRAAGEDDAHYADRVGQVADVVSPGAIVRACNRILAPLGLSACFREVGSRLLPGLYFDLDAFDYDFDMRPSDRFRLLLDYADFRAFFLIGVPPLNWGEFGFAWDVGLFGAWDDAPYLCFWDGYPYVAARIYQQVWQAVNAAKAGGVGFELYVERLGCL